VTGNSGKMFDKLFKNRSDISEAWEGAAGRKMLSLEAQKWLVQAKPWKMFITLTFRNETSIERAKKLVNRLVFELNRDLLGSRRPRSVKHSYFSYVISMEQQTRGVIHFHMIADQPLNQDLLVRLWKSWAGDIDVQAIRDVSNVTNYICKSICKGGEITPYLSSDQFVPNNKPI
jgi:hypothetical protein